MRRSALGLFVLMSAVAPRAMAEDECLDAYDASQRLRRGGKLVAARTELLTCARETCPAAVAKDCTRWLREVNDSLPSVVIAVREANGDDVFDVRVSSGDVLLTERLSGRAIELDPGPHLLRFALSDGRVIEKQIVVREGEKNRQLELRLEAPKTPAPAVKRADRVGHVPLNRKPEQPSSTGIPPLAIALGGLGLVALGSFVYFAIDAKSDVDALEDRCAPDCPQADVDAASRKALIADISLGVGVVALGAAGWLLLTAPESGALARTPGRASISVSGRF